MNTLAARGLEGAIVSVLVLVGNSCWCHLRLRVQYRCDIVLVFWLWWDIVFGVTYVLTVQHSCAVVSGFWLWQEIILKVRTPFDFLCTVSTKKSYWVTLL